MILTPALEGEPWEKEMLWRNRPRELILPEYNSCLLYTADVIQQMAGNSNRMVNEASPIVDTRLADGSRVNIVLSPISIDGAAVSLSLIHILCILGAGDIKLFSIAGGFLTLTQLCYLIPVAFVVGAVIGAGKIVYKKVTVGYAIGTKTFMHFSTAILIGYFIVVWGWGIA